MEPRYSSFKNLLGSTEIAVVYRPAGFVRGDANLDYQINISDPLLVLFHLYGGLPLACADAADFDDDGALALPDVIGTLRFLFQGGPPPAAPFPQPGQDAKDDALPACALGG